ncbi:MAG: hypothetical protein M9939_21260 [Mesorhizobium sp.]|nr:hypothetical protein [Mesorhizobium sp.]MCO5163664.1 hypothetical protein [Mesorhizobium sp.]
MSTQFISGAPAAPDRLRSAEFRAGAAALFILVLTSVHHAWGAYVFDTPFRLHIVFVSIPVAALIVGLFYVTATGRPRVATAARWAAIATIALFPILAIGFYEGGYNHLVKNLVFFVGGEGATREVFSSPMYEMPSDVFFEATGVLQLPAAVYASLQLWRLLRAMR